MSSTPPSRDNGYLIDIKATATRELFQVVFSDVAARLNALELTEADYEDAVDKITTQALAIVSANITEEVQAQRITLAAIREAADTIIAEVEAIQATGIDAVNVRFAAVPGFSPSTVQSAIVALRTALISTDTALRADVAAAIAAIPVPPAFKPITMTVPAANATGLGAGGTYTFIVQAFAGDTVGFYPDYPVPLASRFVNVFEPGGNAPVVVLPVVGSGAAFPVNFTGSGLQTSHAYDFQAGYTDAQGNSVLSQRVRATTAAQFKPSIGQAYEGGYLAYEQFGDGGLFDLVQGPKSLEVSRVWNAAGTLAGALSRVNGPGNTSAGVSQGGATSNSSLVYARSVSIGGVAGDLAAIDEARAISFKLRPANAPAGSPFVSGGSEVFESSAYWTSTEVAASQAKYLSMLDGTENQNDKASGYRVRPTKRIAVTPPIPIGTYVAAQGGWLWFYLTDLSDGTPRTYAVFKADKAVEVIRAWDTGSSTSASTFSRTNGVSNTDTLIAVRYAASVYCRDLVHGGKDDWYLGAIDEMLAGARMNDQLPAAQRLDVGSTTGYYWSSTEIDASTAKRVYVPNASEGARAKNLADSLVIPIRRVLLSAL